METWAELAGFKGHYISNDIPYSFAGDGAITKISWESDISTGTEIVIETSVSFNGGGSWTDWTVCVNGGSIPQIQPTTSLKSTIVKYRVTLETNSPTSSPILLSITFDISPIVILNNKGNTTCIPEIWITKIGNGDFSIVNSSDNNEEFKFTSLVDGETIYVNNERQDIQSSNPVIYRYEDFNDNYLSFPPGMNVLKITGNATIRFRYQFRL
jgi:hypothetical protein